MKVPKRILAVAGLAVVGLLGLQMTPANAASVHAGGGVFAGHASVAPGLFSPVSPNCTTGGVPTLCPGANPGTWSLNATGVGASVSVPTGSVAGPFLTITAHGTLDGGVVAEALLGNTGAWCGSSSGSGHASILVGSATAGSHHTSLSIHWLQSAATVIVFSTVGSTPLGLSEPLGSFTVGVVSAIPPIPTVTAGSCLAGTATSFQVVGAAVVASVTTP